MQPRRNGPVSADKWTEHTSHGARHANLARHLEMQKTWPAECNWQMSPSTKCGQSGSEGHKLAFICGYGSTQHSSCQYLGPTYNMGTWGLTKTELNRLDAHHRRHLRQIIGIRWPHRISNDALYRRTQSSPISVTIRAARWSLFGHVLRMPLDAPVQRAIDAYLEDTGTPTEDAPVVRCRQH